MGTKILSAWFTGPRTLPDTEWEQNTDKIFTQRIEKKKKNKEQLVPRHWGTACLSLGKNRLVLRELSPEFQGQTSPLTEGALPCEFMYTSFITFPGTFFFLGLAQLVLTVGDLLVFLKFYHVPLEGSSSIWLVHTLYQQHPSRRGLRINKHWLEACGWWRTSEDRQALWHPQVLPSGDKCALLLLQATAGARGKVVVLFMPALCIWNSVL